jgi:phenylacetate-CoA ligase
VAPAQIASVLAEIEGQVPPHQIVVERPVALDEITVLLAPSETGVLDELRKQHERLSAIEHRLASELGLSINVKLVERKSVESGPRVLDKRKA